MDGGDLEQERRVANQTNDDRGDMKTEIGDSDRDEASGIANEDKTDHVDLVMPARKIKKPSQGCRQARISGKKSEFWLN